MTEAKLLYRYKDICGRVYLDTINVIKNTPRGYWIKKEPWLSKKTFVLDNGTKRYAYTTVELAKASFLARKERQIIILSARLDAARVAKTAMIRGMIDDKDTLDFE